MKTIIRRLTVALPARGWLLLAILYVLAIVLALLTNPQYGPDSRIYLAWTYWYLGHPQAEAAQLSYNYLWNNHGLADCWSCWPDDYQSKFFTGQYAAVVGPRVLLPFLSAPFVALIGPMGMLVVPIIGYAVAVVATVVLASRLWGQRWALVAGAALLIPVYVSRWSVVAHTEGPAFALLAAPLLLLPLARRVSRKHLVWYVVLVAVGMLNRQFALSLPVAVGFAWALVWIRDRKFRNVWLPFAFWGNLVAFAILIAQMVITPLIFGGEDLGLTQSFNSLSKSYFGKEGLAAIPQVTWNIITSDLLRVRYDLPLVALLAIVTVSVVWRRRSEISALAAGAFLSVSALNIIEFWPAAFRYHAPIVPLLVLAMVALLSDLWGPVRKPPSRSTETELRPDANQLTPETAAAMSEASGVHPRALQWRPTRLGLRWIGTLPIHAWSIVVGVGVVTLYVLKDRTWHYSNSSLYHLAWTYRVLGYSPAEATAKTYDALHTKAFFDAGCAGSCWEYGNTWLFQHATSADPNLVYPVLSAPFVAIFGAAGLLVVSLVSFVVATGMLTYFAAKRWGSMAATLTAVVFILSDRISVAAMAGTADMLAIALCIGCLFTLPLDGPRSRKALLAFTALMAVSLATRSTAIALVGGVFLAWLFEARSARTLRNRWLPYAAISGGLSAAIVAAGQLTPIADARYLGRIGDVLSPASGGVAGAIADRITDMVKIDGHYLAADALLCAVLLITVVVAPMRAFRDPLAALSLGGGIVSVLLGLLVGVPSGARQFSMVYPLFLLTAIAVLFGVGNRFAPYTSRRRPKDGASMTPLVLPEPEPVPAGVAANGSANGAHVGHKPDVPLDPFVTGESGRSEIDPSADLADATDPRSGAGLPDVELAGADLRRDGSLGGADRPATPAAPA